MFRPSENDFIRNVPGYERHEYPETVLRATAGAGGDVFLILCDGMTVVYDCGMMTFAKRTIANIHELLDPLGRKPDALLMSHTHYDHIGALPEFLREWPELQVYGSPVATKVFASETAKRVMGEMEEAAKAQYGLDEVEIDMEGLRIDHTLTDGEELTFGDHRVLCYETKGHTDCCMTYIVYPENMMFCSETLGTYRRKDVVQCAPLKGTESSVEAIDKMSRFDCDWYYSQHYGIVPKPLAKDYFRDAKDMLIRERDLVQKGIEEGLTDDEILEKHKVLDWDEERAKSQPFEAYAINIRAIIKRMRKAYEAEKAVSAK